MRINGSVKAVIIGVAAGSVVALAGIGYAATGSSAAAVKACAAPSGRLALLSPKNTCPKGFKVVTINKQGPRGLTGKTGKTGKTGATGATGQQGPGAHALYLNTDDSGQTSPLRVDGFSYQMLCDVTTAQNGDITVDTQVSIAAPAGSTVSVNTTYSFTTGSSLTPTVSTSRSGPASSAGFHSGVKNDVRHLYVDAMRVFASDGRVQVLSVDLTADARATPGGKRCLIDGLITPSTVSR